VLGLALGKPLGIVRPSSGAGILHGIGFTMPLFIAGLAFTDARQLDAAKVGVLAASALTGIVGWLLLRGAVAARSRPA
jgi:NhaA family Na+:H+ antiporter